MKTKTNWRGMQIAGSKAMPQKGQPPAPSEVLTRYLTAASRHRSLKKDKSR